jgi:serine/threonine protein phosphatase PrpC
VSLKVAVAALSDVGCIRKNNEDFFGYDAARNLYVVCDGVGGMNSGEVASALAVTTLLKAFAASEVESAPLELRLNQAILAANTAVRTEAIQPEHKGMGTTLVVAAVDFTSERQRVLVGNVGDSRVYMIQNKQCLQLTVDHSYLNELIRSGAIAVEDAARVDLQGMGSMITRAIGAADAVEPDFFSVDIQAGDIVLLASDGLSRYVTQTDIADLVSTDLELSCQRLIATAKERGGADNITCLLLHVQSAD